MRPENFAGALHLGRGEDFRGVVRRIVQRGHAERQRGVVDPALLRNDFVGAHRSVPVDVDDAGHDGLAGDVDDLRVRGNGGARARTDGGDAIAVDDDGAVVDDVVAVHGDDARASQREFAGRNVQRLREADVDAGGRSGRQFLRRAGDEREGVFEIA